MIVPLPPGGSTDILARIVAQKFSEGLGKTIIVEQFASATRRPYRFLRF